MAGKTVSHRALERWKRDKLAKEVWFVSPPHHVEKATDAVNVGVVSHFGYEFTMVALGGMSLYHAINRDADLSAVCDRIFIYDLLASETGELAPNVKLEQPLSTFERSIPLNELDLLAVSLTNADAVTSVLNLLSLGGVAHRRADRAKAGQPLIVAGGPGCANPEPFAEFFDFFCIGDGEDVTRALAAAIHETKRSVGRVSDKEVRRRVGQVQGLYASSDYDFVYQADRIVSISSDGAPEKIEPAQPASTEDTVAPRSLVTDGATAVIVPNYGCKHRCSYCQISEVAYREYAIDDMISQVEDYFRNGIKTLIVNSATLTQHKDALPLLQRIADLVDRYGDDITIYIGSVRFDEVDEEVLDQIGRLKGFSHTYLLYTDGSPAKFMALAPEHGSRSLLRRLFRTVDPWRILDTIEAASHQGVYNFVLYFIVGFESETPEDRQELANLVVAVLNKIEPNNGKIILKINPLIPTPSSACQRMAMPSMEEYRSHVEEVCLEVSRQVGERRFAQQVETVMLPENRLVIEAVINRADRRIAPFIERLARHRAAGVEPETSSLQSWLAEVPLNADFLAGARSMDEIVPWQVVDRTSENAERHTLRSRSR
ncbi:MAG: radical SAM protein [Erythrobacter sp.]|nr:radical SAM protein [Erythrobacter sp.]